MDALTRQALRKAVRDSAEVEVQLSLTKGASPIQAVLLKAQTEAGEALTALVDANPDDPKEIRTLQNRVVRFRDLLRWLGMVVAEGFDAEVLLSESDRENAIEMVAGTRVNNEDMPTGDEIYGNAD